MPLRTPGPAAGGMKGDIAGADLDDQPISARRPVSVGSEWVAIQRAEPGPRTLPRRIRVLPLPGRDLIPHQPGPGSERLCWRSRRRCQYLGPPATSSDQNATSDGCNSTVSDEPDPNTASSAGFRALSRFQEHCSARIARQMPGARSSPTSQMPRLSKTPLPCVKKVSVGRAEELAAAAVEVGGGAVAPVEAGAEGVILLEAVGGTNAASSPDPPLRPKRPLRRLPSRRQTQRRTSKH